MPVEIKELVIRATVLSDGARSNTSQSSSDSGSSPVNRDEIIEECVEQVLAILEQKGER